MRERRNTLFKKGMLVWWDGHICQIIDINEYTSYEDELTLMCDDGKVRKVLDTQIDDDLIITRDASSFKNISNAKSSITPRGEAINSNTLQNDEMNYKSKVIFFSY